MNNNRQVINSKNQNIIKERIEYSKDILDKRYHLYTWMETKINLSLMINTILLGFSYFLLDKSTFICSQILIILSILLIGYSLLKCLFLINPIMKSTLWKKHGKKLIDKQPRISIGIETFEIEEYHNCMKIMSLKDMLKYNVDQILKMNRIVNTYSRQLKYIIRLSACALLCLIIALLFPYICNAITK